MVHWFRCSAAWALKAGIGKAQSLVRPSYPATSPDPGLVAAVVFLAALIPIVQYIETLITRHEAVRRGLVRWLVVEHFDASDPDWLGRQLTSLQTWMGERWSGQALGRCLAIAFAYPVALLLIRPPQVGRRSHPGTRAAALRWAHSTRVIRPSTSGATSPALAIASITTVAIRVPPEGSISARPRVRAS